MGIVLKICISEKSGNAMLDIDNIQVKANKGIINDRYFKEENDKDLQITLIESENIDYFNQKSNTKINYIEFRRNIITKGIELNNLIGKYILLGSVKVKAQRLCDPCKYLQDKLKEKNSIKNLSNLYNRGGLRCEILSSGPISVQDKIEVI